MTIIKMTSFYMSESAQLQVSKLIHTFKYGGRDGMATKKIIKSTVQYDL